MQILFGNRSLLAAAGMLFAAAFVSPTEAATLISEKKVYAFVLSQDNVYFTSNAGTTASIWRSSQHTRNQETLVYQETKARFSDILILQVDGIWFAYFFATRLSPPGGTAIKRVPLSGATTATTITSNVRPVAGARPNLVSDGSYLYWQDRNSVRKIPVCGTDQIFDPGNTNRRVRSRSALGQQLLCLAPDTVLEATGENLRPAGLALRGSSVIYADGTNIRHVPTAGNVVTSPLVRTIAKASGRVTTLLAVADGVYWGEASGAVRLRVGSTTTTLPSVSGMAPTSIATNGFTAGGAQAWTQCPQPPPPSSPQCRLQRVFVGGSWPSWVGGDANQVAITTWGTVFWSESRGLLREPP